MKNIERLLKKADKIMGEVVKEKWIDHQCDIPPTNSIIDKELQAVYFQNRAIIEYLKEIYSKYNNS